MPRGNRGRTHRKEEEEDKEEEVYIKEVQSTRRCQVRLGSGQALRLRLRTGRSGFTPLGRDFAERKIALKKEKKKEKEKKENVGIFPVNSSFFLARKKT